MTSLDWKSQEDFDNAWESNKDAGLQEFYNIATELTMSVEHLVRNDMEGEAVYKINKRVANVIDTVNQLGMDFTYRGRFDYNFSEQARLHLQDELSYYKESNNEI
jgi:hypothetical protein